MNKAPFKDWKDKTVIVTGAATGVGKALCHEMASRGAIVYVTARSLEKCLPVVSEITALGFKAFPAQLEVGDSEAFKQVINTVRQEHGKLDVLINNAGILYVGEYADMEEDFMRKIIDVNITSVMLGSLFAYKVMKEQGSGLIVNVSSMAGYLPAPAMTAYSASKHALLGLTSSLAAEAEGSGVGVKAICLGLIESELLNKAEVKEGHGTVYLKLIPMKAMPADIAARKVVDKLTKKGLLILMPWYAKFYKHMQYFFPSMLYRGQVFTMKKYRELVKNADGGSQTS